MTFLCGMMGGFFLGLLTFIVVEYVGLSLSNRKQKQIEKSYSDLTSRIAQLENRDYKEAKWVQ